MAEVVLFWVYMAVMTAALVCFVQAYRLRFDTPRHKRFGLAGCGLALAGIVVVLTVTYVFGIRIPYRDPGIVVWHRRIAIVATALVLLVGISGARRWPIHKRLYVVFVPLYVVTLILALAGYRFS